MKDNFLVLMTGLFVHLLIPVPHSTKISTEIRIKTGRNITEKMSFLVNLFSKFSFGMMLEQKQP